MASSVSVLDGWPVDLALGAYLASLDERSLRRGWVACVLYGVASRECSVVELAGGLAVVSRRLHGVAWPEPLAGEAPPGIPVRPDRPPARPPAHRGKHRPADALLDLLRRAAPGVGDTVEIRAVCHHPAERIKVRNALQRRVAAPELEYVPGVTPAGGRVYAMVRRVRADR